MSPSSVLATANGVAEETYAKALVLAVVLSIITIYLSAQIFGEIAVRIGVLNYLRYWEN